MHITTIIKLIVFCIAMAAIASLIVVLPAYELNNISEETLYAIHYDHPVQTWLAVGGVVLLLLLLLWSLNYRPPVSVYRRFQQLDSTILDSNRHLCRDFYHCALQYRTTKGSQRYRRYFLKHFNFFYEFHNDALSWIDELLARLPSQHIPQDFILHAICSGHIGEIFTDIHYASGLLNAGLKANDPLIFHTHADLIEIWAYDGQRPLCKIRKNSIRLHNVQQQPLYLTAIFSGIDASGESRHQIEVSFLARDFHTGKCRMKIAQRRIAAFKQWLKEVSRSCSNSVIDYGIDVAELLRSVPKHDTPVTRRLSRLEGKSINAVFTRETLPINDKQIPLDAVALCNGIGIVAINEKTESGDITYSGDPIWQQYLGEKVREIMNPCMHSKLARSALSDLLRGQQLIHWPIISLVVFSSNNVTLNRARAKQRLQCDVIQVDDLEKWFAAHQQNDTIRFSETDLHSFRLILGGATIAEPALEYATV